MQRIDNESSMMRSQRLEKEANALLRKAGIGVRSRKNGLYPKTYRGCKKMLTFVGNIQAFDNYYTKDIGEW